MRIVLRAAVAAAWLCCSTLAAAEPADELAGVVGALLAKNFVGDWRGIEKLRGVRWAPLPPKMLENCLPDGGCFTRDGVAEIGGRRLNVVVSGARTMTGNAYLRNTGAPFGETALLDALRRAGFRPALARCPVPGGAGGTNWYRLDAARSNPGHVSIQTACNGRPCEGFVVYPDPDLPPLQPNQLKMYSEQCGGAAGARKPVATVMPHEQFATLLVALLPPANAAAPADWKALTTAPTGIRWNPAGAQKGSLAYKNDPNPWMHSGDVAFSGRTYHLVFGGTPTQVKTGYLEEGGLHPRGEDVLGVLRAQGLVLQLVRCGPVYTHSINNWYRVSGPLSRPVMLRQSIRMDGKQVQDAYELRFDSTLPVRDPRDREPGVGGCR